MATAILKHTINKSTFFYLLKSSFSIAAKSPHNDSLSLSTLFQRYGFPPSQFPIFLQRNQFLLSSNPSAIESCLKILTSSLKPSQDFLVSMVYSCPSVLDLEFLQKWKEGIAQLRVRKFSSVAIRNILEISRKFELSPDDFSRFIKCMIRVGCSEDTVFKVLEAVPNVIMLTEDKIREKIRFLMEIGIQEKDIDRVVGLFPGVLEFGVHSRLKTLLDEFEDLGFSLDEVRREVLREPRVLDLANGELSQCLKMLNSLKCRVPIKDKIFCDGAFRAGFEVKLRVDFLRRHGLLYRDAFTVLWKEPRTILYDIQDIERKIEFLTQIMKLDVQCLVEVPEYLGVNLDKQIMPRYNVIEYLRSKGGLGDEVILRDLVKLSRLRFYNLYVKPYPECEKMYGRFAGNVGVRSRHPIGMWKFFKPPKYPESDEDLNNIRSYIQSLA